MPRDAHIPLFLWIATAVLVHLLGGGSVDRASDWLGEQLELRRFAEGVRSYVKSQNQSLEISIASLDEVLEPPSPPEPAADAKSKALDETADAAEETPPQAKQPELPEEKLEPDSEQKAELEKLEPEKKPETPSETAEAAQQLVLKKRISVRQAVEDQKQAPNPDAEFLGEHDNRVREQTQAHITSNDQNDPKPTPGSSAGGIADQPGNADETRVAHSEDRPGEEGKAPSDDPAAQRPDPSDLPPNAGAAHAANPEHVAKAQTGATSGAERPSDAAAGATTPGSKGQEASRAEAGAPELLAANGGQTLAPRAQQEQAEHEGRRARKKKALPRQKLQGYEGLLGLGASGTTASGINLNLTPGLARDAIGVDQLSRERRADGARRRSQHLGSWKTAGLERWRSAIENYVPSVKAGNQTALNTARAPFAAYLSLIHNRLHPIFADWYLASLDSLPANHPLNRPDLSTNLEIILDEDEGRIVKLGVTKASGVTMFDVAALDSTERAGPFGRPPREIVSPDGRVYLHWEFHRNPAIACTTFNARPYMLKVQPKPAPIPPPKAPDDGAEGERHGAADAPRRF
jgi:hypothetical protein